MTTPVKRVEAEAEGDFEYRVIGEADLDTIPIRRVGWEAPSRFDTPEGAQSYLAEIRRSDPGAINPRIEQRPVGPWSPVQLQDKDTNREDGSE